MVFALQGVMCFSRMLIMALYLMAMRCMVQRLCAAHGPRTAHTQLQQQGQKQSPYGSTHG